MEIVLILTGFFGIILGSIAIYGLATEKSPKKPNKGPVKIPKVLEPIVNEIFPPKKKSYKAPTRYCNRCGQALTLDEVDIQGKRWKVWVCPDCDQIPTKGGETSGQANNPSTPAPSSRGPGASLHPQPVSTRISRYSPDLHRRSPVDARRLAFLKSLKIRTAGEEKELRRLKRKRG